MKVGRSVVALDHRDGAAGPEQSAQNRQRLDRPGQVFQDETDEDVVERPVGEGQGEDVRLPELHVGQPRDVGPGLSRAKVSVCAPTPQPTSRTTLPAGYRVSECSSSTSVPA